MMATKRKTKQQLSAQAAINLLERCLTLTAMAEERRQDAEIAWFAFVEDESAPRPWSSAACPDDYKHAESFGLTGADGERFLDWCANQRHFWFLCESGLHDWEANSLAQNDRSLLRCSPSAQGGRPRSPGAGAVSPRSQRKI